MDDRTQLWNDFAAQLAVDSIRCTTAASSGHPTSSMSAAHLVAVLYADHLRTNVGEPGDLANDRFVVRLRTQAPDSLTGYEERVLSLVKEKATGGSAPLERNPQPKPVG